MESLLTRFLIGNIAIQILLFMFACYEKIDKVNINTWQLIILTIPIMYFVGLIIQKTFQLYYDFRKWNEENYENK